MTHQTIAETLRQARRLHHLNQSDLAHKLDMRQSQISSLERGLVDPRLSTLQDVARVLELELLLVPRQLVPIVKGLVEAPSGGATDARPLYALDGTDEATGANDPE